MVEDVRLAYRIYDQTPWETEEPVGGFEIKITERCWSKNPRRGGKQRTRRMNE